MVLPPLQTRQRAMPGRRSNLIRCIQRWRGPPIIKRRLLSRPWSSTWTICSQIWPPGWKAMKSSCMKGWLRHLAGSLVSPPPLSPCPKPLPVGPQENKSLSDSSSQGHHRHRRWASQGTSGTSFKVSSRLICPDEWRNCIRRWEGLPHPQKERAEVRQDQNQDSMVTKRIQWPHEMVITSQGQPPIYDGVHQPWSAPSLWWCSPARVSP